MSTSVSALKPLSRPTPTPTPTPTAQSDPEGYLALYKFNRRLPRCPRTNKTVTFSDIGDENGTPLIYLLPSGCSRWIAASMDPLAKAFGVRMIVVDRPGCGGTEQVPLSERIERSCEMIVSVLEYLNVKPAHILASSAAIYYTLHLLTRHPSTFLTALTPPPKVYLIAPWSPLLQPTHPEYWPFKWDWIPSTLIATQHITTPTLIKAAENAQKAYDVSTKAINTGRSIALRWFKSLTEPESEPQSTLEPPSDTRSDDADRTPRGSRPGLTSASSSSSTTAVNGLSLESPDEQEKAGLHFPLNPSNTSKDGGRDRDNAEIPNLTPSSDEKRNRALAESATQLLSNTKGGNRVASVVETNLDIPNPHPEGAVELDNYANEEGESRSQRLWGPCECCVSCLTNEYMSAENSQGIGQEHLICLNRGPEDTGAQWLVTAASDLNATLRFAQSPADAARASEDGKRDTDEGPVPCPVEIHVWWGWLDDMVPRKGQLWFNQVMGRYPESIRLTIHDVEDGDHTDLLSRVEGLHQVFEMVRTSSRETS